MLLYVIYTETKLNTYRTIIVNQKKTIDSLNTINWDATIDYSNRHLFLNEEINYKQDTIII